jgi:hypothetical protein
MQMGGTYENSTAIGYNAKTRASNEVVLGCNLVTRIRPDSDVSCDLGNSSYKFGYLYAKQTLNNNISLAAAGTISSDATVIDTLYNRVKITSGASNTGVILSNADIGHEVIIYNGSGNTVYIYPTAGSTLSNTPSSSSVALSYNHSVRCIYWSAGIWEIWDIQ